MISRTWLGLATALLASCWSPSTTGPTSMVGTLHDPSGAPLPGVTVDTLESSWRTDAEGTFKVNYKAAEAFLHFKHDGLRYQRAYLPADEGTQVRLTLPRTRPSTLVCHGVPPCKAELVWELEEGFQTTLRAPCDIDEPHPVEALPPGPPSRAVCRASPTDPDLTLTPSLKHGELHLTPPPVEVRVALSTSEPALPRTCEVRIGDAAATLNDDGLWVGRAWGHTTVTARCDGVLATPAVYFFLRSTTIPLQWTPHNPTAALKSVLDDLQTTRIRAISPNEHPLWDIQLTPAEDGTLALPPLPPGDYVFGMNLPHATFDKLRVNHLASPGQLEWVRAPAAVAADASRAAWMGALRLEAPLDAGALPTRRVEAGAAPDGVPRAPGAPTE